MKAFVALIKQEKGLKRNPDRNTLHAIAQMLLTNWLLAEEVKQLGLPQQREIARQLQAARDRTLVRMHMEVYLAALRDTDN